MCTKTFMGDTGSLILGYALSYLAIKLAMDNDAVLPYRPESLLVSYSLVLVPTFDLIRVALFRLKKKVSIFHADKTHIHHKFLAAGYSMHTALINILSLEIGFCIFNFVLFKFIANLTLIVVADIVIFSMVQWLLSKKIAKIQGKVIS